MHLPLTSKLSSPSEVSEPPRSRQIAALPSLSGRATSFKSGHQMGSPAQVEPEMFETCLQPKSCLTFPRFSLSSCFEQDRLVSGPILLYKCTYLPAHYQMIMTEKWYTCLSDLPVDLHLAEEVRSGHTQGVYAPPQPEVKIAAYLRYAL